jgi:hypothetical protein
MASRNLSGVEDLLVRLPAGERKTSAVAFRVYIGIRDLYLSCPAVSQQEIAFDRPIAGEILHQLIPIVEEGGVAGGSPLM